MDIYDKRNLVIEIAKGYIGKWYKWGGDDPSGFDCSGLVIECLKSVGVLPRNGDWTASDLATNMGWLVTSLPANGDLVFWKNSAGKPIHVEICINDFISLSTY